MAFQSQHVGAGYVTDDEPSRLADGHRDATDRAGAEKSVTGMRRLVQRAFGSQRRCLTIPPQKPKR